jgi:hypothetical protein
VKALVMGGAPFDLDTDRWAHPWVASTVRDPVHWTLGQQQKALQAAPGTALQISWDAQFAATWFCLLPGLV